MKRKFISLEGIDGCGKTTLALKLVAHLQSFFGRDHVVAVREPGGTALGDTLRGILLDRKTKICDKAELLLFFSARAQLIDEVIKPALEAGKIVVADRFVDSTVAYQGYGRGLSYPLIRNLCYGVVGEENMFPGLTFWLDCPVDVAIKRLIRTGKAPDRFEVAGQEFALAVREGFKYCYKECCKGHPPGDMYQEGRIIRVDASQSEEAVFERIIQHPCWMSLISTREK